MYICICHMYLCIFIYHISSTTVTRYKRVWELCREHQGATFKHLAKKNHPLCGWRAKTDQTPVVGGGVFPFEIDHFSTTISLKVSIPKITSNWRDVPSTPMKRDVMWCLLQFTGVFVTKNQPKNSWSDPTQLLKNPPSVTRSVEVFLGILNPNPTIPVFLGGLHVSNNIPIQPS